MKVGDLTTKWLTEAGILNTASYFVGTSPNAGVTTPFAPEGNRLAVHSARLPAGTHRASLLLEAASIHMNISIGSLWPDKWTVSELYFRWSCLDKGCDNLTGLDKGPEKLAFPSKISTCDPFYSNSYIIAFPPSSSIFLFPVHACLILIREISRGNSVYRWSISDLIACNSCSGVNNESEDTRKSGRDIVTINTRTRVSTNDKVRLLQF